MANTNLRFGDTIYFTHHELACKATGGVKLAPAFATALLDLRITYNRPMAVSSCCRSAEHNESIRGHKRSLHVYDFPQHPTGGTVAIDIYWPPAEVDRSLLVITALRLGWSVGVAKWGVHLDRRDYVALPQNVFGYGG